ncbi:MAG: Asp-tRNA(Asn)/Glu-tRNA(Gln) amidotransferase subunit GatB [Saccharofermentans sp.]|jgi:aspartyl-tRNA(Asn)/glutamyl-tRNA(Gln) amidotransferase subunit B|nr:Asp-tRNA(Asn)/Glu-tRNA(Gln) amidotransferase subunit GatB [Mageeibacillus sp.]MCI1264145.1 Asp-tRNA(Asn)/Glu-tRNA(Gln) amidotransferase subunit GatB [Saccharofermentans sp.]MCI1275384.1 Asp-tRNA(Asn)/Glu-tRNA(Gln) amidotransferase subunit GatB [Saccharofermentans sp.]MCI1768741.1 Asp-tRNA(Asn)/Glu-tRNA(Gln) amidotransferase subunit GatB [Mageeibacillus sp.]
MRDYEMVIGLEVHCELATESKIFCGCSAKFGGEPNTHVCEVCSGMPGTLPTLNRKVVNYAVRAGLALNCEITRKNKFDRKNYFYPDLPKAYQISQLYYPICRNGHVDIRTANGGRTIGIHEIHMEEDAGKLVHDPVTGMTMVDFNRCGVPLLEIVSEPDFRSAEEVIAYLTKLKDTMQYLGVSDCKMQEGSMRCDVNLSVRPEGQKEFGTRTEMKNIASLRAIERAIEYERERQIDVIEEGGSITQETRRWDDDKEYTYCMRSKENAQDYKYFPDPDLMPVEISDEYLEEVRASLPEFADAKRERYVREFGLPEYDADIITGATSLVKIFEKATAVTNQPKDVSNWLMTDLLKLCKDEGTAAEDMTFDGGRLGTIINMVNAGKINRKTGREVLAEIYSNGGDPEEYVKSHNLAQVSDSSAIEPVIENVLAANGKAVSEYLAGSEKNFQFLVGQSMKALRGKADPQAVRAALEKLLGKMK